MVGEHPGVGHVVFLKAGRLQRLEHDEAGDRSGNLTRPAGGPPTLLTGPPERPSMAIKIEKGFYLQTT